MEEDKQPYLKLKWGNIKGWDNFTPHQVDLIQEWLNEGVSYSVMSDIVTERKKELICNIIDTMHDGMIFNDYEGKVVSVEEAKDYINNYNRN